MKVPRRSSISGALWEIVFIVVGVLIAFQADRWWAERDEAVREQAQLEALLVDMRENLTRLDQVIADQRRLLDAQRQLLRLIHKVDIAPETPEVGRLVTEARRFYRLEPVTGAYDALVASGDLRLVGNAELRAELARFFGEAARGYEDEGLSTLYRVEFTKAVVSETDFLAAMPPDVRGLYDAPESRFPLGVEALVNSESVSSYLALLLRTEFYTTGFYERLRTDAEKIVQLITDEIVSAS